MRFIMVQGVTGRAEDPLRAGVVGAPHDAGVEQRQQGQPIAAAEAPLHLQQIAFDLKGGGCGRRPGARSLTSAVS